MLMNYVLEAKSVDLDWSRQTAVTSAEAEGPAPGNKETSADLSAKDCTTV
jgi:hypothetical protein